MKKVYLTKMFALLVMFSILLAGCAQPTEAPAPVVTEAPAPVVTEAPAPVETEAPAEPAPATEEPQPEPEVFTFGMLYGGTV